MMTIEIFLLLFCLAGSAFFAGIETGVISINRLRLQHLVRELNREGARIARAACDDAEARTPGKPRFVVEFRHRLYLFRFHYHVQSLLI